jgi:hypothetical protein
MMADLDKLPITGDKAFSLFGTTCFAILFRSSVSVGLVMMTFLPVGDQRDGLNADEDSGL